MPSVLDVIVHCQKQIKKEPPADKLIHYLNRLDRLRVGVQDLMDTGIGRTVNQLSRHDGDVGKFASNLVKKWKAMVSDENSEDSDSQSSSSSQEDEESDEGGEDREDNNNSDHQEDEEEKASSPQPTSPVVVKVENVNGHHHHHRKHQLDHEDDDFLHAADSDDDDDEDRMCIADEYVAKGSKACSNNNKSKTLNDTDASSSSVIKQERILANSSGEETDVCEDMDDVIDDNPIEESTKFLSPPQHSKFKTERLSESDHSSAEEEDEAEESKVVFPSTQIVPQKSHIHKETKENVKHVRKDACNNQIVDIELNSSMKETGLQKSATLVLENKSSSRHSSEKHKNKDRHHSAERKGHKKDVEEIPSPIKIKVEQSKSDDSVDSEDHRHHSSRNKEKKSKRKSKDKNSSSINNNNKHSSEDHRKSKDHHHKSDKKEKHHGDSHKTSKHKHNDKEKEKRDSGRNRANNGESSSGGKRKSEESLSSKSKSRTSSSSPDFKKIKLEESSSRTSSTTTTRQKEHSLTKKPSIHIDEEINSASGVKFEELLGCLDKNLIKDRHKEKEKSKKHHSSSSSSSGNKRRDTKDEVTKLVRRNDVKKKPTTEDNKLKKKHLESVIAPTSLNISPNYKPPLASTMIPRPMLPIMSLKHSAPAGNLNILETCDPGNYWEDSRMPYSKDSIHNTQDDALATMMSGRNQRTKVFSGRAVACTGKVPRLFDMCMQVIQENIGDLGYTGGVPFEILKPALERATAQQLLQIEEFNPYLIGSTDELWRFHCNREFRGRDRQEMETWRELYERCMFERDEKFAIVRKKMLKKSEVAVPVRKAKLAYVEPVGGPRFSRQKAATIKNGMKSLKIKEEKGPKKGVGSSASVGFNNPVDSSRIVHEQAVLISPESRAGSSRGGGGGSGGGGRGGGDGGESTARAGKPRKAPLMARTMKFIRTLQRR